MVAILLQWLFGWFILLNQQVPLIKKKGTVAAARGSPWELSRPLKLVKSRIYFVWIAYTLCFFPFSPNAFSLFFFGLNLKAFQVDMLSPSDQTPQLPGPVPMFILPSHPCYACKLLVTHRLCCQAGRDLGNGMRTRCHPPVPTERTENDRTSSWPSAIFKRLRLQLRRGQRADRCSLHQGQCPQDNWSILPFLH